MAIAEHQAEVESYLPMRVVWAFGCRMAAAGFSIRRDGLRDVVCWVQKSWVYLTMGIRLLFGRELCDVAFLLATSGVYDGWDSTDLPSSASRLR